MKSLLISVLLAMMLVCIATPLSASAYPMPPETLEEAAVDCGIDWDAKIDSSDGFVKLRATNTCDFSVRFIVAVYATDGTVNRTRNYCYAPKQTGVIVIGKGDWIQRVAVESPSRC